jgi:hypothetical protein
MIVAETDAATDRVRSVVRFTEVPTITVTEATIAFAPWKMFATAVAVTVCATVRDARKVRVELAVTVCEIVRAVFTARLPVPVIV